MTPSEARKNLMLGLIYPAVLGSVLYSAVQAAIDPVMRHIVKWSLPHFDSAIAFKLLILTIAIVFFTCDYLYITFTNHLRVWFFMADCVFLVLMYVVWWAIDINGGSLTQPHVGIVLSALLIFMLVYLSWDLAELRGTTGNERSLYKCVIAWEIGSAAVLGTVLTARRSGHYSDTLFACAVSAITAVFALLSWHKRKYVRQQD